MKYTKEDIVSEYKKLRESLGCPPSSAVFLAETGITKRTMEKVFGSNSYSKLVSECGDVAYDFYKQKSDLDEILIKWGNLTRSLGKLPTTADWAHSNNNPTSDGIRRSHNLNWGDIAYKFLEFNSDKSEWADIISLIPSRFSNGPLLNKTVGKVERLTYEYSKFIPPIVQDLMELSRSENKSREFEKSVNLVFQMLGFEVSEYGQGTGRNPDGVAKENQYRYAILIDAKSRQDAYKMGTEDRKFIEYIKNFSDPLRKQGFVNIYFLIVSSSFDAPSPKTISNIKVETQVPTTLLTSLQLLKILSKKIQAPRLFDMKNFQELLVEGGKIEEKRIEKFISR